MAILTIVIEERKSITVPDDMEMTLEAIDGFLQENGNMAAIEPEEIRVVSMDVYSEAGESLFEWYS